MVVSKQSATKAGENTSMFFLPDFANSITVLSVYGLSHLSFNLDWKVIEYLPSCSLSFSTNNRAVL